MEYSQRLQEYLRKVLQYLLTHTNPVDGTKGVSVGKEFTVVSLKGTKEPPQAVVLPVSDIIVSVNNQTSAHKTGQLFPQGSETAPLEGRSKAINDTGELSGGAAEVPDQLST